MPSSPKTNIPEIHVHLDTQALALHGTPLQDCKNTPPTTPKKSCIETFTTRADTPKMSLGLPSAATSLKLEDHILNPGPISQTTLHDTLVLLDRQKPGAKYLDLEPKLTEMGVFYIDELLAIKQEKMLRFSGLPFIKLANLYQFVQVSL